MKNGNKCGHKNSKGTVKLGGVDKFTNPGSKGTVKLGGTKHPFTNPNSKGSVRNGGG